MKKSLILVGMLVVGYANAQEGNVGINTEVPKATLEVLPSAKNLEGTTNEGIIIPKLTKARVLAIADANLVEGTKVYITDEVLDSDNAKFQGIGKGFYFYNGTKWVKQLDSDNDTNTELWEQTTENGETKTYLKASKGTVDIFGFIDRGEGKGQQYTRVLGEHSSLNDENSNLAKYSKIVPNLEVVTSKAIPLTNTLGNRAFYDFNRREALVETTHVANSTSSVLRYNGGNNILWIDDNVSKNIDYLNGQTFSVGTGTETTSFNKNIGNIVALQGMLDLKSTASTTVATGLIINANNHEEGALSNLVGARIGTNNHKGTIRNMDGLIVTNYLNGGTISNIHRGINLELANRDETSVSNVTGIQSRYIHRGTIQGQYIGLYNSFEPQRAEATVGNFYGYRLNLDLTRVTANAEGKKILATNAYGLHMDDVNFASGDNYSIYTNAGQVRFGDLRGSGNRNVYVDADGVLKAGSSADAEAGKVASTTGMQCNAENRGKMNFIQGADGKSDVFGICMKNADGNYYWGYMVGGNNPTNGTGAFGSGL